MEAMRELYLVLAFTGVVVLPAAVFILYDALTD
jgi:hypothetical protein